MLDNYQLKGGLPLPRGGGGSRDERFFTYIILRCASHKEISCPLEGYIYVQEGKFSRVDEPRGFSLQASNPSGFNSPMGRIHLPREFLVLFYCIYPPVQINMSAGTINKSLDPFV